MAPPRRSSSRTHKSSISSGYRPSRLPSAGRTRSARSSIALSRAGSISLRRAVKKRSQCWLLPSCELTRDFAFRYRTGQKLDKSVNRVCLGQVDTALKRRLDQAADDLRTADRPSVLQTDVDRQPIKVSHVPIEQHDRDLCPRFGVHNWAPTIGFCRRTRTQHVSPLVSGSRGDNQITIAGRRKSTA